MNSKLKSLLMILPLALTLQGCAVVSYNVQPNSAWKATKPAVTINSKLAYAVSEYSGLSLGGFHDFPAIVKRAQIFTEAERVYQNPGKGYYVLIETRNKQPSIVGLGWGYIALSTLFLLPAYNGTSGFDVTYHVYRDGQLIKSYPYEIQRKGFAWLPMVLFIWVNLITDSEPDAFKAITNQFFTDAVRDGVFGTRSAAL